MSDDINAARETVDDINAASVAAPEIGEAAAASTVKAPDGSSLPVTARSSLIGPDAASLRSPAVQLVGVTGTGLPWFRGLDPLDVPLGMFTGTALAPVSSQVDALGGYLPGVFAVETAGNGSPWVVMRLRPAT